MKLMVTTKPPLELQRWPSQTLRHSRPFLQRWRWRRLLPQGRP